MPSSQRIRLTRTNVTAKLLCGALLAVALPAQAERTPVPAESVEAPADPALVADVVRQLTASDLAVVAQGAYTAAEHRLRDTVPALRTALARLRAQSTNEQRLCAMTVLDALVRTDANVPPAEVALFLQHWHDAALVLLAQHPEQRSQPAWCAC